MDCKHAQKVWGHPGGFMAGMQATFPEVLAHLERTVTDLIEGRTNPFNDTVHRKAGVAGTYYVDHGDDTDPITHATHDVVGDAAACTLLEQHFMQKFGQPIFLGNICCSGGCKSIERLSLDDLVAIQNAAVRTNADGSDIAL